MIYSNYNFNDSISFNSRVISTGTIRVKNNEIWRQYPVNLVKLEFDKFKDRNILNELVHLWQGRNSIGQINSYVKYKNIPDAEVFALIKKGKDICAKNILGVMATSRFNQHSKIVSVYNISTAPWYSYNKKATTRNIKHIGRELFHTVKIYIKKTYNKRTYVEYAYEDEKEFLRKIKAHTICKG